MTQRNRVLTRDELLDELVSRTDERDRITSDRLSHRDVIGGVLDDLAELGTDPVGRAKAITDEELT